MKLRALVLIFTLGLAANGLAQDVATDVTKGVKGTGKATKTTSKDAALPQNRLRRIRRMPLTN